MAGRNHNTAVKILSPYNVRNTWRGRNMQQIGICTGCRKSGNQRILKHITGTAGILTDHDGCFVILSKIPSQKTSHFVSMLHRQINICLPAETIRTKIFSHLFALLILSFKITLITLH